MCSSSNCSQVTELIPWSRIILENLVVSGLIFKPGVFKICGSCVTA
jgi:hypothetical protein